REVLSEGPGMALVHSGMGFPPNSSRRGATFTATSHRLFPGRRRPCTTGNAAHGAAPGKDSRRAGAAPGRGEKQEASPAEGLVAACADRVAAAGQIDLAPQGSDLFTSFQIPQGEARRAPGRHRFGVRAENNTIWPRAYFQGAKLLAGDHIPQPHRPALVISGQQLLVPADGTIRNRFLVPGECTDLLACLHVPNLHSLFLTARDQPAAVVS